MAQVEPYLFSSTQGLFSAHQPIAHFNVMKVMDYSEREKRKLALVLTKSPDQLILYSPGEFLHQAKSSEASKQQIVEKDNIEVSQPVEPPEVSQQVKPCDP